MSSTRLLVAGSLTAAIAIIGPPVSSTDNTDEGDFSYPLQRVTLSGFSGAPLNAYGSDEPYIPHAEELSVVEQEQPEASQEVSTEALPEKEKTEQTAPVESSMVGVKEIPFYSQLTDISDPHWQKLGCGIVSLAMILEHHEPGTITSIDAILQEGIDAGAYLRGAGWIHQGLADIAHRYGLEGRPYDLSGRDMDAAFDHLLNSLEKGPVIASVYYRFDIHSPIPHLAVINGVKDGMVYYNDPAENVGGKALPLSDFKRGWKKRYITAYPSS